MSYSKYSDIIKKIIVDSENYNLAVPGEITSGSIDIAEDGNLDCGSISVNNSVLVDTSKNITARDITSSTLTSGKLVKNTSGKLVSTALDESSIVTTSGSQTITGKSIVCTQLTGTLQSAQFPTLTGDVSNSGLAITIANNSVTLAKMATMATASILGRNTSGTGNPEVLSASTVNSLLGISSTVSSALASYTGSSSLVTLGNASATGLTVNGDLNVGLTGNAYFLSSQFQLKNGGGTKLATISISNMPTDSTVHTHYLPTPNTSDPTFVTEDGIQTLSYKNLNSPTICDSIDLTKKISFVMSSNTTGTTRQLTVPNYNGTLSTLAGVESIQNKTLDNSNTITLKDTLFTLQDDADTTKQARFQLSSIGTNTTRTYTLPNANDTIVTCNTTQSLTNKTITMIDDNFFVVDGADTSKVAMFDASLISTSTVRTLTCPNASGTIVLNDNTASLTNKSLAATSLTTSGALSMTGTTNAFIPATVTTTQKNAISTPATGSLVYDSTLNKLNTYNGANWVNAGGVLSVYNAALSGTQSISTAMGPTNSASTIAGLGGAEVTSLNVTLTPKSSSSKFLLIATVYVGTNTVQGFSCFARQIGSGAGSAIKVGNGATGGASQTTCNASAYSDSNNAIVSPLAMSYVDSPATSSSIYYTIICGSESTATIFVNRSNLNSNTSAYSLTSSNFTIIEYI